MKIKILTLVAVILLTSCMQKKSKTIETREVKEKAVLVMVQEMVPRDLDKYIVVTGKVAGITDVDLVSETNGKVVEIFKNLGDWVEKGEALGRVDNTDTKNQLMQAEASLMAAEAALESANLNLKAANNLYRNDMISESEYLSIKSNQKNAQAGYNGLTAALESSKKAFQNSEFTSPVSGYIAELKLEIGEMVNPGKHIAGIVNSKQLILKTGVSESDISFVKVNDPVVIEYKDNEFKGKITGVGIRPVTGGNNYPVEIVMNNIGEKLYPGMIVEGHIYSQTYKNVLYTSVENLREKYDKKFVYVINSENRAELKIVELREKVINNVIILSGVKAGDKLVIDGIDSLSDGTLVEIKSGFDIK